MGDQKKKWTARSATITGAENGFIVQLTTFESTVTLVCKDGMELVEILGGVEWRTDAPRALPMGGPVGATEAEVTRPIREPSTPRRTW